MRYPVAAAVGLAALLIVTSVGTKAQGIDYAGINADVSAHHIRSGYGQLNEKVQALFSALKDLCKNTTTTTLDQARLAFHGAVDAWQAVEHIRFGPAQTQNAHARANFWPDKRGRVDKHLWRLMTRKDAEAALKPIAFAKGSVAVQGFSALERLLFGNDVLAQIKRPATAVTPCAVATAISVNITDLAKVLATEWRQDVMAEKQAKDGTGDLFNSFAGGLQATVDLKLGGPLGIKSGRLRTKRAEHWRSARALRNIMVNLSALEDLYLRLSDGAGKRLTSTPEDKLIRQLFGQAIADTKALGPSFTAVARSKNGVHKLWTLAGSLQDLRELAVPKLAEGLGLVLGFNSLDGD